MKSFIKSIVSTLVVCFALSTPAINANSIIGGNSYDIQRSNNTLVGRNGGGQYQGNRTGQIDRDDALINGTVAGGIVAQPVVMTTY